LRKRFSHWGEKEEEKLRFDAEEIGQMRSGVPMGRTGRKNWRRVTAAGKKKKNPENPETWSAFVLREKEENGEGRLDDGGE